MRGKLEYEWWKNLPHNLEHIFVFLVLLSRCLFYLSFVHIFPLELILIFLLPSIHSIGVSLTCNLPWAFHTRLISLLVLLCATLFLSDSKRRERKHVFFASFCPLKMRQFHACIYNFHPSGSETYTINQFI